MWSAVNGRSGLEEGKVSQATRSVEKARWRFVDRALSHGFRAVVCAIRVAAIVGLSGLASIALAAPGALGGDGPVQPRIVAAIEELIQTEARDGHYEPPVEPSTLAYAIVRLAEAFLFNDAAAGMRGDVGRLREVEAALLGVSRRASGL